MKLKTIITRNFDIEKFVKLHKFKQFSGNDIRANKLSIQMQAVQKYNGVSIIKLYEELSKYTSIDLASGLTIASINTTSFLLFVELITNRSGSIKFNNDYIWTLMSLTLITRASFFTPISLMKKSKYYIQFFTIILPDLIDKGFINIDIGIYEYKALTVELTNSNCLILFNDEIRHEVPLNNEFTITINVLINELYFKHEVYSN